jgi:serine protease Do
MTRKISIAILSIVSVLFTISAAYSFPAVQVYKKASGSVVLIVASAGGSGSMMGTGSIITENGLVITNAHVVMDTGTGRPYGKIRIYTKPDVVTGDIRQDLSKPYKASVSAIDKDLDLALLKVEGLGGGHGRISLANPKEIMVGEEVVAIGHPEQGGLWTLTYGRISGQIANQSKISGKDVFQTDTDLNRGNSGGPLLDRRGYMVGVNTNIARRGAGDLAITGVNFSIKSSVVTAWLRNNGVNVGYGDEPLYSDDSAGAVAVPPTGGDKPAGQAVPQAKEEAVAPRAAEGQRTVSGSDRVVSGNDERTIKKQGTRERKTRYGRKATRDTSRMTESRQKQEARIKEEGIKSGEMLTPKRPYSEDEVFRQAEQELEDMMNDIKMKMR